MPTIPLSTPAAVTRAGATDSWSFSPGGYGMPATSSSYTPGDKSYFARFKLDGSGLTANPGVLSVSVSHSYSPVSGDATVVINDYVALGDSTGPTGSNQATNSPIGGTDNYALGSGAFSLASLQAGNVYLWLGYRAQLSSAPTGTVTYTPTGSTVLDGSTTLSWSGSGPWGVSAGTSVVSSGSVQVNVASSDPFVVLSVTATESGSIAQAGASAGTGTLSQSDSLGGSFSGSGSATYSHTTPTTARVRVDISGGTGATSVSLSSSANKTSGVVAFVQATANVTATVASLLATDITLSSIAVSYSTGGGSGSSSGAGGQTNGSSILGASSTQDEQEMTTLYIDDTLTFWAQFAQYSSGAALDATGSPAYRIYEENTNTPVLTGTMALLDDPNTTGLYQGQAVLSAANGFDVGKCYCVRVSATVDGIAQAGIVERFVVRAVPATALAVTNLPASVWQYSLPAFSASRATTVGGAVAQVWRYFFNKNTVSKTSQTQTLYDDSNGASALTAQVTMNSSLTDKGRIG